MQDGEGESTTHPILLIAGGKHLLGLLSVTLTVKEGNKYPYPSMERKDT